MHFDDLQLIDPLLRATRDQGYTEPTPIQEQAIPPVLQGRDLIGLAQTGTGKTLAFAMPILQRLHENAAKRNPKARRHVQVLVLAPTRELASQIGDSFKVYGRHIKFFYTTIFGGVSQRPQADNLRRGVDVVIATPGRLLDLMNQGLVRLDRLEVLVLDEADRMLDMGFLPDIRRIIENLPTQRQTLLFSATMPPDIQELANSILIDPLQVEVTPESTTVEAIDQTVFFVEKSDKRRLLEHLLIHRNMHRTLVFTRTKHAANRLSEQLAKSKVSAEAIHGNKSQKAREQALANFKRGKIQVLVATDIAARGIDVDDISHVVNFDLPNETESYVHRIGRTGRAGATGSALSFCSMDERDYLVDIERLIGMRIPVTAEHPFPSSAGVPEPTDLNSTRRPAKKRKPQYGARNGNGNGGGGRLRSGNGHSRNGGGGSNGSRSENGSNSQNRRRNQQRRKPTQA